jgi:hypothetical protein
VCVCGIYHQEKKEKTDHIHLFITFIMSYAKVANAADAVYTTPVVNVQDGDHVRAKCLVVDTAPLLSGANLARMATELYTVPEVVAEVRSRRAREVLERTPLNIRSPNEEAMREGKYIMLTM